MNKLATRLPTHTDEKVQEHHQGRYYMTPKRSRYETQRLQQLARDIAHQPEFTVTRKLMHGPVIKVSVDAVTPGEAKAVADEVVYAINWQRGMFKKDHTKKPPEQWALGYEDYELVKGR